MSLYIRRVHTIAEGWVDMEGVSARRFIGNKHALGKTMFLNSVSHQLKRYSQSSQLPNEHQHLHYTEIRKLIDNVILK